MMTNGLPAVHPGAFLGELLHELNLSQVEFSQVVEVPPGRLSAVIHGEQPVTADLALLFAQAFDQSPHYWLNLQAEYDLATVSSMMESQLLRVHRVMSHEGRLSSRR